MINLEKYKDKIIRAGSMFGVDADGEIRHCCNIECKQCRLNDNVHNCYKARIEWMLEEAMQELLPCPFCGSRAELDIERGFPYVHCTCCTARTGTCDTNEEAIEEWNRRA